MLVATSRFVLAAVAATVLSLCAPPTFAQAQDSPDEAVVELVVQAAPMDVPLVVGNFEAGSLEAPAITTDAVVTIPESPDGTIVVDAPSEGARTASSIGIALPEQVDSYNGRVTDSGAVVYLGVGSDVDVVVQPVEDGSVRINTVLHQERAPHDFTYQLSLPGTAVLNAQEDGSIAILDGLDFLGGIAAPWAVDAAGAPVATRFEIDGHSFTQVVQPVPETRYPIVADPYLGSALISKAVWASNLWQYSPTLKVYPTWWGRNAPMAARWAAWTETLDKAPRSGWPNPNTESMKNQFYCHYDIVRLRAPNKEYWGLDSKLPNRGYWGFVNNDCN
jgi:hypothetical protein